MAWCPFAVHQPIPETYTQGKITPNTLIFHEAVSGADSLYGYWTSGGVELESHFYIGRTGTLYQFVDTGVRADANYNANGFAVSVETWDNAGDVNLAWNPEMLATAKRLAAWVCEVHGIKAEAPRSWNSGGIGGHNWFASEWAGGPRACPGPNRSAQIRNDIIPHVANGGGWKEDELLPDERNAVISTWKAIFERGGAQGDQSFIDRFVELQLNTRDLKAEVALLKAALAKVSAGNVDYDLLAAKVADQLSARLSE